MSASSNTPAKASGDLLAITKAYDLLKELKGLKGKLETVKSKKLYLSHLNGAWNKCSFFFAYTKPVKNE